MKLFTGILIVISVLTTSLLSTSQAAQPTQYVIQHRIVTRSVPVLVNPHKIPRFKLLRGNPHRVAHFLTNDDDDFIDDDGIVTSYRRRDLQKIEHEDDISEDIRWRLFLARQMALLKYREAHG